jgi:hypothetical protein
MKKNNKRQPGSRKGSTTLQMERERFIAAARELECDESPEAFEATLRKLTSGKPITNSELKRKAKKKKGL